MLVLVSVMPPGLAAEGTGSIVFQSGPADADGVFTMTATAYDLTAWGVQLVLRYDTAVLQPVDASGVPATSFDSFAKLSAPWLDTIGTELDAEKGLINFTYFILPGATGDERINADSDIVVGSEGLEVFTFRFKRLKEGDTGLQIATEAKGEPFQESCPDGLMAYDVNGPVSVDIIFRDAAGSGQTESYTAGASETPKTVDGLLREAIILKLGSHAAVVKGNATALYYGERDVTVYAHDERTFVPIRFVGERLGAEVGWEGDSQTATVTKDGHVIRMPIGSAVFTLDGEEKTLDAPAELTPSTEGNFRTMVPIRFVSEALGYQVEWDQARNLVIIAPESLNWDPAGEVEAQAMDTAVMTLTLYGNFV